MTIQASQGQVEGQNYGWTLYPVLITELRGVFQAVSEFSVWASGFIRVSRRVEESRGFNTPVVLVIIFLWLFLYCQTKTQTHMNYIVVNSFNGNIVLMGSEEFCNEYRHEFPSPEYKIMEEEMYDDYIISLQDAWEGLCDIAQ